MRRDIEWTDRLEDGLKRTVRIKFPGGGKIKWQFKMSDSETWDYDTPPTAEEWARLEEKLDVLYHRRRVPLKDLELVRLFRAKAGSSGS